MYSPLALFHTFFNVVGVFLILPFQKPIVKMLNKMFISSESKGVDKYLSADSRHSLYNY